MKFNELYIGMSIYLLSSPDTFGIIIKYIGKMYPDDFWVIVDFGDHEEEFLLSELGKFKVGK